MTFSLSTFQSQQGVRPGEEEEEETKPKNGQLHIQWICLQVYNGS